MTQSTHTKGDIVKDKIAKVVDAGFYRAKDWDQEQPKTKVTFENEGEYTFFGRFDHKQGDTINMKIGNPKYRTASLIKEEKTFKPKNSNDMVIMSALRAACDLHAHKQISNEEVVETANYFLTNYFNK